MSAPAPKAAAVILSMLQETWDDASTDTLSNAELAAVLEMWLYAKEEDSALLRCIVERLRTGLP